LIASEAGSATEHADVLFELLRLREGTFTFTEAEGGAQVDAGESVAVAPVLEEAGQRLEAWREIEAVVPSSAVAVGLVDELRGARVTLTADRWRAVVAVAAGRTVGDVAGRLGVGE